MINNNNRNQTRPAKIIRGHAHCRLSSKIYIIKVDLYMCSIIMNWNSCSRFRRTRSSILLLFQWRPRVGFFEYFPSVIKSFSRPHRTYTLIYIYEILYSRLLLLLLLLRLGSRTVLDRAAAAVITYFYVYIITQELLYYKFRRVRYMYYYYLKQGT